MERQRAYAWVTLSITLLTILLKQFGLSFDLVNIALIYLLPVLLSAVYWGKGPSFYAAGIGVLAFDFFFVPPVLSFSVADLRYLISFIVFFSVAALTASLAAKLKQQLHYSKQREAHTASLYEISKEISAFADIHALLHNVTLQVSQVMQVDGVIYLPNSKDELALTAPSVQALSFSQTEGDFVIANWVYQNGIMAGRGTPTLSESPGLYLPLRSEERIYGVLGIHLGQQTLSAENLRFLDALTGLTASAIARVKLSEEAKLAQLTAESERLRTAILDSVSHELRTPLASIIGSATAMIEGDGLFSSEDRMELLSTIRDGALRMNRLVSNLLGMVQLESGMLSLRRDWCDVEDIIGVVLKQVKDFQQNRTIRIVMPEHGVPLLLLGDEVLLQQMLVNVVSNAIKYSPDYSEVTIQARVETEAVSITVADEGEGIAEKDRERVFDKFYRVEKTRHVPGTGLGLAICKGIAELHGGMISAEPNKPRGVIIAINLPRCENNSEPPMQADGSRIT